MGKHRWPTTAETRDYSIFAPGAGASETIDHVYPSGGVGVRDDPSAGSINSSVHTLALRRKHARRDIPEIDQQRHPHDAKSQDEDFDGEVDDTVDVGPLSTSHGEPGDHDRLPAAGIRWGVARSAALVFLGVAFAVGAALFLVRSSEPSAAAVSVHLDANDRERGDVNGSSASSGRSDDMSGPATSGETPPGAGEWTESVAVTSSPATAGGGEGGTEMPGNIVVYVTGAVASPGIASVPAGTRLFEILEQVGGPLPDADLEGINLAGLPTDGEHVHVLAIGEVPRAPSGTPAPSSATRATADAAAGTSADSSPSPGTVPGGPPTGIIDINAATLAEIESLPRVGPVLGQRIIEWRDTNGPFAQPGDIDAVPGIGPALLEGILPLISTR